MRLVDLWIFFLILSIICLIISIGIFEAYYKGVLGNTSYWVFALFILGVLLLLGAFIVYIIDRAPGLCYRGTTCYPCKDPGQTCVTKACKFTID